MSLPRQVIPGTTYMLTRRCFDRTFFLRPSPKINQIVKFCLAVALERTGCLLHAYVIMSNHVHLVVTDPEGNLPTFMQWFNEFVAKCVNAELGRWESFWAPGSYSRVELADREALMSKMVYVITNPVTAGLVHRHDLWPGAISLPDQVLGHSEVIERPTGFFRENGSVPESAVLRIVPHEEYSADPTSWRDELAELVSEREDKIQLDFRARGKRFLGRRKVLRQSPFANPDTVAPRRGLNPRVATKDKWRRIEVLQRLKSFLEAYREAWKRYTDGDHLAVFPFGTYLMQVRFGVLCSGP